jgi:hypothetical protein
MGPSHRWMPNVGRCTVGNARIHRITLSIRNQLPKSSQIFSGCSDELRWKANRDNINSMSSAQLRGWPSHNYYYQYCSGICNDVVDDHACYVVVYICSNEHNCHHTPDMHRAFFVQVSYAIWHHLTLIKRFLLTWNHYISCAGSR